MEGEYCLRVVSSPKRHLYGCRKIKTKEYSGRRILRNLISIARVEIDVEDEVEEFRIIFDTFLIDFVAKLEKIFLFRFLCRRELSLEKK